MVNTVICIEEIKHLLPFLTKISQLSLVPAAKVPRYYTLRFILSGVGQNQVLELRNKVNHLFIQQTFIGHLICSGLCTYMVYKTDLFVELTSGSGEKTIFLFIVINFWCPERK